MAETCPDCKGTGQYIGLFTVEPCRTCQTKTNPGVMGEALEVLQLTFFSGKPPQSVSGCAPEPTPVLSREKLFELGKKGPYVRFVSFPVELRGDSITSPGKGEGI